MHKQNTYGRLAVKHMQLYIRGEGSEKVWSFSCIALDSNCWKILKPFAPQALKTWSLPPPPLVYAANHI